MYFRDGGETEASARARRYDRALRAAGEHAGSEALAKNGSSPR